MQLCIDLMQPNTVYNVKSFDDADVTATKSNMEAWSYHIVTWMQDANKYTMANVQVVMYYTNQIWQQLHKET
jgi:hypothetical protein